MFKRQFLFLLFAGLFSVLSCWAQKSIVIYYSQGGNTRQIAEEIQKQTGSAILELQVVDAYSDGYAATVARVRKEMNDKKLPILKAYNLDLSKYKTIYLGFPVWLGKPALPIQQFLKQTDLKGKRVIPFSSYGAGGMNSSLKIIKELAPQAKISTSYGISRFRLSSAPKELKTFLKSAESHPKKLGSYSATRALNDEDRAVFKAAMSTREHRMEYIPQNVQTQVVSGTNYIFHCKATNSQGQTKYYAIKVYKPLQGTPEIVSMDGEEVSK